MTTTEPEEAALQDDPPAYTFRDDTIQGSKLFFDLLKSEQDRLSAKLRTADERARGNGTISLAAIAVINLLSTLQATLPTWLVTATILGVMAVLGLTVTIIFNRSTTGILPRALWQERKDLWQDDRSYMEIMQFHQKGWIENIAELHRLQALKYRLLDAQNIALIILLALLVLALAWRPLGLH